MNQVPLNPFPIAPPSGEQAPADPLVAGEGGPKNGRRRGRPRKPPVEAPTRRKRRPLGSIAAKAIQRRQPRPTPVEATDELGIVMTLVDQLNTLSKPSRTRILAALTKVFT